MASVVGDQSWALTGEKNYSIRDQVKATLTLDHLAKKVNFFIRQEFIR